MKKNYALILCLLGPFFGFSQTQTDSLKVVPEDERSLLVERSLPKDLSRTYDGEAFNYDIKTGESQNLLTRFLNWLGRGLQDIFGINISPEAFNILEILIYVLMGALVIYLLIRLLANEKFNSIFVKKAKSIADIDLAEQHIEDLDLDELLNKAIKNKNYRLAIRYHYLRVLKKLSHANLIEWHFDKTNADYQKEIEKPKIKSGFKRVSYLYDYIWYGEQPIDEASYTKANESFTLLNQQIPQQP
ncbi:DUF4129 domain-containing protein [uncultured Croceitalea sp.]|uniref:DUF4129 domain-containing protein n=1 Tax=uncultured Croceitalea sp. TaxID=1798908 RepID=UPI003305AC8B